MYVIALSMTMNILYKQCICKYIFKYYIILNKSNALLTKLISSVFPKTQPVP